MTKFPTGTPPTTLYLDTATRHHQKHDAYFVAEPNLYGTGDNRELSTEYALSTTNEQFRAPLNSGHCSALLGCGDAHEALPAMAYTKNGVQALAP